jgi:hypothetical protein
MNQRIRQLADEAGYTTDMFGVGHWDMPECKKFAQLIVQHCIYKFGQTRTEPSLEKYIMESLKNES